jgi:hypothetical protein
MHAFPQEGRQKAQPSANDDKPTLMMGFEPFVVINAQEMADELRKTCVGATSGMSVQPTSFSY